MRATLLTFALFAGTAYADESMLSGPELGELHYACFGEDAEAFAGDRAGANDACRQWDEIQAQATKAGLCLDQMDDFKWKPCA